MIKEKPDIATRTDIDLLLKVFYGKVRIHEVLGPIFNAVIHDWDDHLVTIGDFWMNTIFYDKLYHGNPMRKHLELDKKIGGTIEQEHFGYWLELWFATVDKNFKGQNAHLAKERARNMAHILFMRIYEQRTT